MRRAVAVLVILGMFSVGALTIRHFLMTAPEEAQDWWLEDPKVSEMWRKMRLIYTGLFTYALVRGEYPASLEELCATPYIAVPCSEIREPWQGRPILEVPEGEPGYIDYRRREDGKVERRVWVLRQDGGGTAEGYYPPLAPVVFGLPRFKIISYLVEDWTEREWRVYAMTQFLGSLILTYERENGQYPADWNALRNAFPEEFSWLRNPYGGELVLIPPREWSEFTEDDRQAPGAISWWVLRADDGSVSWVRLIGHGEGGRILWPYMEKAA